MMDIPIGSLGDPEDTSRNSPQVTALILHARSYVGDGIYLEALSYLNDAVEIQPSSATIRAYRGLVYACLEQDESALIDYTYALSCAGMGEEAMVYYYRGLLYGRRGEHEKACSDFSSALEREPGNQTYREARDEARRECISLQDRQV